MEVYPREIWYFIIARASNFILETAKHQRVAIMDALPFEIAPHKK